MLPLFVIILLMVLFITFLNEVVSNTAMASIMIPLMAITSISMGINPMMLMAPAALASSLGFMPPRRYPAERDRLWDRVHFDTRDGKGRFCPQYHRLHPDHAVHDVHHPVLHPAFHPNFGVGGYTRV